MLNLYKLTQNKNDAFDTYQGFVVAAKSEHDAKVMCIKRTNYNEYNCFVSKLSDIKCQYIGEYKFKTPKIILEDFKRG